MFATYKRLLAATDFSTHRFLYKTFDVSNRLTGIIGPRGTGKTTMLLQYIRNSMGDPDQCMYASLDNIYFSKNTLLDFVNELYDVYGIRYFFLDEIHKYPSWNQEIKNVYDSYPDVTVAFTGSSSIDLQHGSFDLSRRCVLHRLPGLSFREYLLFRGAADVDPISLTEILHNHTAHESQFARIDRLRGYFQEYLRHGYYPFFNEQITVYNQKLFRIIEKTIYEDIANYYKLKTENLHYFKRILAFVASIPPGELNRNSIAKTIGLDNKTVQTYLEILQATGLASLVATAKAGSGALKPTEKIFLDNPNMYHAIAAETGYALHTGSIREIFFVTMLRNAGHHVHYSKTGDFIVGNTVFEIGGRNKTVKQIASSLDSAMLVKDDILYGTKYEIPLYLFGFLY